eukprot:gene1764-2430_t
MPAIPISARSSIAEHSTILTERIDRTDRKETNISVPPLTDRTDSTDQTDKKDTGRKATRHLNYTVNCEPPRDKTTRLRNATLPGDDVGSNSKSSVTKSFKQLPPAMMTVDPGSLVYLKELGHGLTGQVFLCQLPVREGKGYAAVKLMRKKRLIKENQARAAC